MKVLVLLIVQCFVCVQLGFGLSPASQVSINLEHVKNAPLFDAAAWPDLSLPVKPPAPPKAPEASKLPKTLQAYYGAPVSYLVGLALATTLLPLIFGFSLWYIVPYSLLAIPLLYRAGVVIEPYWKGSKFYRYFDFLRNNAGFVLGTIVLYGAMEILAHLLMVHSMPALFLSFTIVSALGLLAFGFPVIYGGFVSVFKAFDRLQKGQNPFKALGMSFVRGLSLFLFILLPAIGIFHLNLSLVALIAASVKLASIMKRKAREHQLESLAELKNRNIPDEVVLLAVNGRRLPKPLRMPIDQVEHCIEQDCSLLIHVPKESWVPKIDGLVVATEEHRQLMVDESELNGESLPVALNVGDEIKGGTYVLGSDVQIYVQRAGASSDIGAIEQSLKRFNRKGLSKIDRFGDKISHYFLATVLFFAAIGFVIAYLPAASVTAGVVAALTVFVVICPCAFLIGIPLAFSSARQNLNAKHKISINDDRAFLFPRVMVFDKTNTVTDGVRLDEQQPWMWMPENLSGIAIQDQQSLLGEKLFLAAQAEAAWLPNPYAQAIIDPIIKQGFADRLELEDLKNQVSSEMLPSAGGIVAKPLDRKGKQHHVFLGNLSSLKQLLPSLDPLQERAMEEQVQRLLSEQGKVITPVIYYDLKNQRPLMIFRVENVLREGVSEFLEFYEKSSHLSLSQKFLNSISKLFFQLEAYPQRTMALVASGDKKQAVARVLEQLPFAFALAEVTPQEKAYVVALLKNAPWLDAFQNELQGLGQKPVWNYLEFKQQLVQRSYMTVVQINELEQAVQSAQGKDQSPAENVVFFMGDGSNDRQAMQQAHGGISFAGARSIGQGDILLSKNAHGASLFEQLRYTLRLFQKTYGVVLNNVFWVAIVWNVVMLSLIFVGLIGPGVAALLHALNTVVLIIWALSLMSDPGEFLRKETRKLWKERPSKKGPLPRFIPKEQEVEFYETYDAFASRSTSPDRIAALQTFQQNVRALKQSV